MTKNDDKYTDPELRTEIKEKIQDGDKGGQPGQWSARKAQMMASEYKKEMQARGDEPYTTDKSEQSDSQKHLSEWTKEDWQTSDGSGEAKQEDATEKRYLPKKAWENMSEEERQATNKKKLEGSKEGKQYVPNTDAAKKARKGAQGDTEANEDQDMNDVDGHDKLANGDASSLSRGTKNKRPQDEDDGKKEDKEENAHASGDNDKGDEPATKAVKTNEGKKRATRSSTRGKDTENGKEDRVEDNEHGQPGSKDRLPEEDQSVHWKAGGWAQGTVVTVLRSETEYEGLPAKAPENDPRIVVKSAKSGKNAIHKPEAVYW